MRMVPDSINLFVTIHNGASVSRIHLSSSPAGTNSAGSPFCVLSRPGVVLRRVFIKVDFGFVVFFSIFVPFGISFATLNCWWRSSQMAFHTRISTFVIAIRVVFRTIDCVCLGTCLGLA